jgi:EmrB/QacA subfamily drug resistance transporter
MPLPRERLVPLIVAVALFMENIDANVISTSLPAIAKDLGTSPITLKMGVTAYLLSLAIFLPASGWIADRFGPRNVFRIAIGVFVIGSLVCATATSLPHFVAGRIVQGSAGALMAPVARLLLVRSVDKQSLVDAMAWLSIPALLGPVLGPPVGGFITTYASWHWIFLINVPVGIAGIFLVTRFIPIIEAELRDPLDLVGLVLSGLAVAGLAFGLSVAGFDIIPLPYVIALIVGGALAAFAFSRHARRVEAPALDFSLLALPTFRASIVGGSLFRIGIGALPFLLPLLMQLGFGLSPFQSGLVTFSSAIGAITMKAVAGRILRRFGFRSLLTVNAIIGGAFVAACGLFAPGLSFAIIISVLVIGGFFRSLQFTSINVLAYAEVDARRMGRATTLAAVAQQVSLAAGIALGAFIVETTVRHGGSTTISAADFPLAFMIVGLMSAVSAFFFWKLPSGAGEQLSRRTPPA